MKYKAILFDLDGTLLPMELKEFQMTSSRLFVEEMEKYGYDPEKLAMVNLEGIKAMSSNDGSMTNEEAYIKKICEIYGYDIMKDYRLFKDYYGGEFDKVKEVCGCNPLAGKTVKMLKDKGYRLVLATKPWFPDSGLKMRLKWAQVDWEDFEFMTDYENSKFCKPAIEYYEEILERLELKGNECLMVGNDVDDDMTAAGAGIDVFLLTDCLINTEGADISIYPKGGFTDLLEFLENH